jgi:hypothetical protein
MSADRDERRAEAELQRLSEAVEQLAGLFSLVQAETVALAGQLGAAHDKIADVRLELAEQAAAAAVELRRQLLINERQSRGLAELARALGGRLVEVAPSPPPKPKPHLTIVVDNSPEGTP